MLLRHGADCLLLFSKQAIEVVAALSRNLSHICDNIVLEFRIIIQRRRRSRCGQLQTFMQQLDNDAGNKAMADAIDPAIFAR